MGDAKKIYRAGRDKLRQVGRDADGHTLADDAGNIGDSARTSLSNARDDVREGARGVKRDAERHGESGRGRRP